MLQLDTPLPRGFRPASGSGLIVPEDVSRARELWTKQEWKLINRAVKLLKTRDVSLQLRCGATNCSDPRLESLKQGDTAILRCGHKDRVFQKAL